MKKLLLLLLFTFAIVGCSKSSKTVRANSNPQTTISYSITPNKDIYEPGEEFVIEATITGQSIIDGTPIEISWETNPDNNEFTPTISDNTLMYTNSASSTPGEYIDITATPIQISINDIPQVTGNYTIRIITASTYTPTAEEVNLIQSLNMTETVEFSTFYDLNGDETILPNQQTIDIDSVNLGDTVTVKFNTMKGQISTTSGDQVEMNSLNSTKFTVKNVTYISKALEGGYETIKGNGEQPSTFSLFYLDNTFTAYSIFGNSYKFTANASLTFQDGTTFLLNSYIEFSSDSETPFQYYAESHDSVPCNADVFNKYVLYTADNTPITTTENTESGYAEIIEYNINDGDESYYKVCL